MELRDGVKIDGKTGTAAPKAKYDFELLSAGTKFPLFFELLIEESKDETQLKQALAIALSGFEKGKIAIGMKKRRGFGRCKVDNWQVWEFDLTDTQQRLAWLTFDRDWAVEYAIYKTPDAVHLKSKRNGKSESIISGTSLAGVLRHRAVKIVKTLNPNIKVPKGKDRQPKIIEKIFGFVAEDEKRKDKPKAQSSRLIVEEKVIENPTELVQTRIAIDRFTGGAMHGALFEEQPVFASNETCVTLQIELRNPKDYEIGL